MALRLMSREAQPYPVSVKAFDGGKQKTLKGEVSFKALPQSEVDKVIAEREAGGSDKALLNQVVAGWNSLPDLDGNDIPFNDENKEAVFDVTHYAAAFVEAYFEFARGGRRRKN